MRIMTVVQEPGCRGWGKNQSRAAAPEWRKWGDGEGGEEVEKNIETAGGEEQEKDKD